MGGEGKKYQLHAQSFFPSLYKELTHLTALSTDGIAYRRYRNINHSVNNESMLTMNQHIDLSGNRVCFMDDECD